MIAFGIVALALAATLVITVVQMRRTIAHPAAGRLGHVAGAMTGIGITLIGFEAAADGLDDAAAWVTVLAVAACVLLTVVLARLGAQQATAFARHHRAAPPAPGPTMQLEPEQRVVWSTTMSSKWLLIPAIAVLMLGPFLMLLPDVPAWLLVVVVLAGVACLSLASIRVSADAGGLRVKYGVLPWPVTNIAADRIEAASVIDVRPMEWGGWGYRGMLTLMRQAAVVLRAGPGIRVDLADGRVFVVTVDDPETGVAVLNAARSRARQV